MDTIIDYNQSSTDRRASPSNRIRVRRPIISFFILFFDNNEISSSNFDSLPTVLGLFFFCRSRVRVIVQWAKRFTVQPDRKICFNPSTEDLSVKVGCTAKSIYFVWFAGFVSECIQYRKIVRSCDRCC